MNTKAIEIYIDQSNLSDRDSALWEIALQLARHNERAERWENEWSNMMRPQISELGRQLWPKLMTALDKAAKGIFG